MARNRTYGKLQNQINDLNLTSAQREGINEIINTMTRRYFQLELTSKRDGKRTAMSNYKGAQLAVRELSATFNGDNILKERV
jgi:hypothetical protein